MFAECVATSGLPIVVLRGARHRPHRALDGRLLHHGRVLVHSVDVVRESRRDDCSLLTQSFAGIDPANVLGFCTAQFVGAALAVGFDRVVLASK